MLIFDDIVDKFFKPSTLKSAGYFVDATMKEKVLPGTAPATAATRATPPQAPQPRQWRSYRQAKKLSLPLNDEPPTEFPPLFWTLPHPEPINRSKPKPDAEAAPDGDGTKGGGKAGSLPPPAPPPPKV